MSSLNDDVEEGLDQDVHPSDLVQPPTPNIKPKTDTTFVTNVDSTKPQSNVQDADVIEESSPGELPDINPKFEIISQDHTTVVDLKQIEDQITGQGNISREDASLINDIFGNFFSSRLSEKEFTSIRTKTNLQASLAFMRKRIAQEELELFNKFKVFFEEPLEDFKQFQHHYETYYIPFIKDQILTIQSEYRDTFNKVFESNNVIIPWGNDGKTFVNLLTFPTKNELADNKVNEPILNEALVNIHAIFTNATFVGYLQSVISNGISIQEWSQLISHDDYYDNNLLLGDILKFYNSRFVLESLDNMLLVIQATVTSFSKLANDANEVESNFEELDKYLVSKVPELKALNDHLQTLFEVAKNLSLLTLSVKPFLEYLTKRCL